MKTDSDPSVNNPELLEAELDDLDKVVETLRSGRFDVAMNGEALEMGKVLGEGGSKTVVEAFVNGERLALALPNRTDSGDKARMKWRGVLREPGNTQKVRALGIPTNPLCERLQTEVNGIPFDLVVMAPYDATGYEVRDRKNRHSSVMVSELLPDELNATNAQEVFADILADVEVLIKAGVQVGSDSVNICKDQEGRLRLYLNDLGTVEFSSFDTGQFGEMARYYVGSAMAALINGLDDVEWAKHGDFLDGSEMNQYLEGPVFNLLVGNVAAAVRK